MKEPRKLFLGASPLICLLVLALFYVKFYGSNIILFDRWIQKWSNEEVSQEIKESIRRLVRGKDLTKLEATGFACDSALHSLVCVSTKLARIETTSMTVHISKRQTAAEAEFDAIRPYARREDEGLMKYISPVHILQEDNIRVVPLPCKYTHNVPVIIFSSGLTGNLFHELNDIIIPLFITSRHFQSRVHFMVSDYNPLFIKKYKSVLSLLSSYQVMNKDSEGSIHCFPGVVVGLKYHDNLALNSSDIPGGHSMPEFKQFLMQSFNLKFKNVKQIKRPVLILISRRKTRVILNENKLVGMIKELGFRVIVAPVDKMQNLDEFSQVVNSCNVMVGVHGAGLTNQLFLPTGAVTVQMVLLGLNWASENYFGSPAQQMGLKYLEYKINPGESSLSNEYGPHDPVLTDPGYGLSKGYQVARALYVDGQNVTIDLSMFKPTLIEALGHLRHSNYTI